ncbi:alpha/beta hydrolase [Natronosporangium hydrolyticum]|uniref:Alpha/beta hydrolase n=1 Tax=Natronosporangium hydrolyticum TaxID=2811111 RepID=A0A895YE61_9ACTN|nr:alpha/beta hydrolase [Natronosporangium hydrolyticum]QSB13689.1 alpha/beta hydrolase [Natronosporangium hydrolyticum]
MEPDLLGPPYEQRTLEFEPDDEGPVVATLIRRRAPHPSRRAVLWVHGWSDYFFQTHVADFFIGQGYDFYALDLRKHGRSLRPHQTATFCRDLTEYFPELDEAARIIRTVDEHDTLVLAAHSTGALTTALWAHQRRPSRPADALFFNSPFFDLHLPAWARPPLEVTAGELARRRPYGAVRRPLYPVYGHSLHVDYRGEWSYDLAWKPIGGFPVRYGWYAAVRAGQRRLQAGLSIDVPVLVACSTRSLRTLTWRELARRCDTVLDVDDITRWTPMLGRLVTLLRIPGGMHDLTLSAAPVRTHLFTELARWLRGYGGGEPPASPRSVLAAAPSTTAPAPPAAPPNDPDGVPADRG